MRNFFINFRKSESGATLVEYGVALVLAILVGGGALVTLAGGVTTNMDAGCNALDVSDQGVNGVDPTGCVEEADPG